MYAVQVTALVYTLLSIIYMIVDSSSSDGSNTGILAGIIGGIVAVIIVIIIVVIICIVVCHKRKGSVKQKNQFNCLSHAYT